MITTGTFIYAVLGNPVAHSLSPAIHNAAFAAAGYNGAYVAFHVRDIRAAIIGLRSLGIRGASITIPHKIKVMAELDQLDESALNIGSVNTIVNSNGILSGYNTDSLGAVRALLDQTTIQGKQTIIIGAGGTARAIGFGILKQGGQITIVNRTPEKGKTLAEDLGGRFIPMADIKKVTCDLLINTTPVGMSPYMDAMPISGNFLNREMVVMDSIYTPLKTRLLLAAEKKGCKIVTGIKMFVHQGALQFELWTGLPAPIDIMKKTVLSALERQFSP